MNYNFKYQMVMKKYNLTADMLGERFIRKEKKIKSYVKSLKMRFAKSMTEAKQKAVQISAMQDLSDLDEDMCYILAEGMDIEVQPSPPPQAPPQTPQAPPRPEGQPRVRPRPQARPEARPRPQAEAPKKKGFLGGLDEFLFGSDEDE